jgi:uncharacterized protein
VIAVDTNILVYAHREEFPQHRQANAALRRLAEGPSAWALPVFVLGEFLRVVTHPRYLDPPTSLATALTSVDALLRSPSLVLISPGERYWQLLSETARSGAARGNLLLDAQIAAVCLEHGARTLLTEDRDFRRFDKITSMDLAAASSS